MAQVALSFGKREAPSIENLFYDYLYFLNLKYKGQVLSAIIPLTAISTDLVGPVTLPFMVFSGFFVNNEYTFHLKPSNP